MRQKHLPIRLRTDGPDIVVELDFGIPNKDGNSYVEVLREKTYTHGRLDLICSEVLDGGIERAKYEHYNT